MRKFKLDKNTSTRLAALLLAGAFTISLGGCKSKKVQSDESTTSIVVLNDDSVDLVKNKLISLFSDLNPDTVNDFTLIMLIDSIAKEDENGKIHSDVISQHKNKIDSDNMMSNFNALLDELEMNMIRDGKVTRISEVLPYEYSFDAEALSAIESLTQEVIDLSNDNDAAKLEEKFSKIYDLVVLEKEVDLGGITFSIRDLGYGNRAVALAYARTIAYYSRNYIASEKLEDMDNRTNDQNNKAYIKTILEILANEMNEKSEVNVQELFSKKYSSVDKNLENKLSLSSESIVELVNYANLKYLNSDKVSKSDKKDVLGEYDDSKVSDAILAIDAIHTYNLGLSSSDESQFVYSNLLVSEYKNTTAGKIDAVALDYVQYNATMLLKTISETSDFNEIFNNPYFQNIYKYFTKQNFSHTYGNGEQVDINWQDISDGTNFVCNEIIRFTLSKLPSIDYADNFIEIATENLSQSIQYIQNTIMGECEKVDVKEFIKQ